MRKSFSNYLMPTGRKRKGAKRDDQMENYYVTYKCKRCKKETILINEELSNTLREGHYVSCAHCGSKHVIKTSASDSLKDIIQEGHVYKRRHGALIQMR